jgi:glycosyltransferase involved in cell wall biosynthesis
VKLVVIIPALNEEKTVGAVLDGIPAGIPGIDAIEKIVIDDGSDDHTAEIASAHGARVIRHLENRGVGAAFSTGINAALEAQADIIVNMDGDGQFDPSGISDLIQPLLAGRAEFTTCTRFARRDLIPRMPLIKRWGNRWMCMIINAVTANRFTDVSCGFRAYTRDTALRLNLFGDFTYTQETFLDLAQKKVRMAEVPLKVRGEREFGTSRVAGSISRYALRAGSIILLSLRDTKPLVFFGVIGLAVLLAGVAAGVFLVVHWLDTGMTTPYQSLVTVSALAMILGFLLIVLALVADMLGRQRRNQDLILYLLKKQVHDRHSPAGANPLD